MRVIAILISLLILYSCNRNQCSCEVDQAIQIYNDSIVRGYYESPLMLPARYYFQIDEPNIYHKSEEVVRLELRTIPGGAGEIYRLERAQEKYFMIYKRIKPTYVIAESDTTGLSEEQGEAFFSLLQANCYENLSSDIKEDDEIVNGTLFVLEVNKRETYCSSNRFHFMVRKQPDALQQQNQVFLKLVRALIKLRNG